MKKNIVKLFLLSISIFLFLAFYLEENRKPVLYIIGDSTVKNGSGKGDGGLWGWGDFISNHFDTAGIDVRNFARGGRSSRTFQSEGLWNEVLNLLKPGDHVLIQFGHNDGGSLNTGRSRGTLKGAGEEIEEVIMEATNQPAIIHTYGWYIKKYITDARAKDAIPIILSPIPRNIWTEEGKVTRANEDYGKWAMEAANEKGAYYIDLNGIIADKYDEIGQVYVDSLFFVKDHTHTTKEGAILNAASVIEGIRLLHDSLLISLIRNEK